MNAPVKLPAEATEATEATRVEPAKPATIAEHVTDIFSALATQLRLKPEDARALFECAVTSIELTPEVALAMPGGRALLREEYERGLRSDANGAERYLKGLSGRESDIETALELRYPIPTKRVRSEVETSRGVCWYTDDAWRADVNGTRYTCNNATDACYVIGATDDDYPRVLALRDTPTVVVAMDDEREAIA